MYSTQNKFNVIAPGTSGPSRHSAKTHSVADTILGVSSSTAILMKTKTKKEMRPFKNEEAKDAQFPAEKQFRATVNKHTDHKQMHLAT